MERNGVALDIELLRDMSHSLGKEMLRLEAEIYNSVGYRFNINSSQQLSRILFEELKLTQGTQNKERLFHRSLGARRTKRNSPCN